MHDREWKRSLAAARRWEWFFVRDLSTAVLWVEFERRLEMLVNTHLLFECPSPELQWHVRLMLRELMWRGELLHV